MSPHTRPPCPHELRPGTTVCLHCRREARAAARARMRRLALRTGAATAGLVIVAAIAANAVEMLQRLHPAEERRFAATTSSQESPRARPTEAMVMPPAAARLASAEIAPPSTAPDPAPPALPRVADGRTELGAGVYAVREGTSVTVHFDTPSTRTRRRDKFERIVRATLPRIYGALADSLLAGTPAGALVPVGELPAQLESRGLQFPIADGWTLTLWPETRPANGGPLVVAYRTTLTH